MRTLHFRRVFCLSHFRRFFVRFMISRFLCVHISQLRLLALSGIYYQISAPLQLSPRNGRRLEFINHAEPSLCNPRKYMYRPNKGWDSSFPVQQDFARDLHTLFTYFRIIAECREKEREREVESEVLPAVQTSSVAIARAIRAIRQFLSLISRKGTRAKGGREEHSIFSPM